MSPQRRICLIADAMDPSGAGEAGSVPRASVLDGLARGSPVELHLLHRAGAALPGEDLARSFGSPVQLHVAPPLEQRDPAEMALYPSRAAFESAWQIGRASCRERV